jgi:hypothetical protein
MTRITATAAVNRIGDLTHRDRLPKSTFCQPTSLTTRWSTPVHDHCHGQTYSSLPQWSRSCCARTQIARGPHDRLVSHIPFRVVARKCTSAFPHHRPPTRLQRIGQEVRTVLSIECWTTWVILVPVGYLVIDHVRIAGTRRCRAGNHGLRGNSVRGTHCRRRTHCRRVRRHRL